MVYATALFADCNNFNCRRTSSAAEAPHVHVPDGDTDDLPIILVSDITVSALHSFLRGDTKSLPTVSHFTIGESFLRSATSWPWKGLGYIPRLPDSPVV